MADPEQINADHAPSGTDRSAATWVARQEHTDITTLAPGVGVVARSSCGALRRASAGRRLLLRSIPLDIAAGSAGRPSWGTRGSVHISGPLLG